MYLKLKVNKILLVLRNSNKVKSTNILVNKQLENYKKRKQYNKNKE